MTGRGSVGILFVALLAYGLWRIFRSGSASMTPARRRALAITSAACLLFTPLIFAFSDPLRLILALRDLGTVPFRGCLLLNSAVSAVIIVELARTVLPSAHSWNDKTHFSAVGLAWLVLSLMQQVFVTIGLDRL